MSNFMHNELYEINNNNKFTYDYTFFITVCNSDFHFLIVTFVVISSEAYYHCSEPHIYYLKFMECVATLQINFILYNCK